MMTFLTMITALATSITAIWAIVKTLKSWLPSIEDGNIIINNNYTPIIITKIVAQKGTFACIGRDEKGSGRYVDSEKTEIVVNHALYYNKQFELKTKGIFFNGKQYPIYAKPTFDFSKGLSFSYVKINMYPLEEIESI